MTSQATLARPRRTDRGASGGPLRVLDITKFYSATSGGIRTYLDAKIHDFASRDVSHSLVVPDEHASVTTVGNTRIYRIPGPIIPPAPSYRLMLSASAIERIVEIERPDVIEVGSPFLVPILVRRAIRARPIRTVGFYHSDLIRTYAEPYVTGGATSPVRVATRALARYMIRRIYRRFDLTVAASASVARDLETLGLPEVETVSLGVDLALFRPDGPIAPLRARLGIPHDVPIALFAGRLSPEKRLDVVLDAHARIPESARPHVVLVGEGPLRDRFFHESRERARLTVLPFEKDRVALAATFRAADYYLASGPGETFGLSIAEALASGLPAVVVNRGAAPDRVAGSTCGRLYEHGDVESCRAALLAMGDAIGAGLRVAARKHAEREYAWRTTFDRLVGLYGSLVASSGRSGAAADARTGIGSEARA